MTIITILCLLLAMVAMRGPGEGIIYALGATIASVVALATFGA